MNFLGVFKKIGEIASSPVTIGIVRQINPIAGVILSTAVQGIVDVQEVLPAGSNDLKKKIVMDLMANHGEAMGVHMDEAQTSVLVEGFLKAIKDAANTAPTKPLKATNVVAIDAAKQ